MITVKKCSRWKNSEHVPIVLLAVTIVLIIRWCNQHDERTANQYVIEDHRQGSSKSCSLYPHTLQSILRSDRMKIEL